MRPIFEYMDYREFLQASFDEHKMKHEFYSYRLFSQKAGFKSPNFLKLVINGQRNLTKESVNKVAKAFNLNKKELDYFENLVFLNQSKLLEDKNRYLTRLMKYRVKRELYTLEESHYDYYSKWYNPILHELITAIDFNGDLKKLGSMIIPAVSAAEVEKSIALLLSLKLIVKQKDGVYQKKYASFSTGPQVKSVAVANYHKAMMQLASEAIERFPSEKRDITSVTLSVSDENYELIKHKIQSLRKELLDIAESETAPNKVVQMNFQLFPLSCDLKNQEDS